MAGCVSFALLSLVFVLTEAIQSGDNVQVWDCNGSDRQTWVIADDGSNNIRLSKTDFCLNIQDGKTTDGTNVNVEVCDKAIPKYQQFSYDATNHRILTLLQNNKVLDGSNYGKSDGTNVWEWDWLDGTNQKWYYDNGTMSFSYGENRKLCLDAGTTIVPCSSQEVKNLPFCNYTLSVKERVEDLLSRLTPAEMVSQLGTNAASIERLDIPPYQWWSEALHGIANSPGVKFIGQLTSATSFPQVINLGATRDMVKVKSMAEAIANEARAFHNQGQAGLTFFAPNINIYRDPRWGRGHETPGEDPYLTSEYVVNFARGMQEGEDPRYLKTIVTCKHFSVYNLENDSSISRHTFNAVVSDQDLMETYFPAWDACVSKGNAYSVMCSYNAVNGVPSCANSLFQNTAMRDEWGFEGYIVSDCGAINDIKNSHHYAPTDDATVLLGLRGGCDLDCGAFYTEHGLAAYNDKVITIDDLQLAVGRLFTARMKLGMFDPINQQPYSKIQPEVVNSYENQKLALQLAQESIVLLKNDGTLPVYRKKVIAVIGPNYNATKVMQGNYNGNAPYLISPLAGIQTYATQVVYAPGCSSVWCPDKSGFNASIEVAMKADVVVMVMGISTEVESEGHDRVAITLPGYQVDLMEAIAAAVKEPPIVVVLMSGGPVDMSWAKANANALLWVGYPGQAGGLAIADVLFGNISPSGRLPWTMYPANYVNQVQYTNVSMRVGPGRTYRFYSGTPVYPFGYGLSYTEFKFEWEEGQKLNGGNTVSTNEILASNGISYRVKVTNIGPLESDVAVEAFATSSVPGAPKMTLFGFQRVTLKAQQSVTLFFASEPQTWMLTDEKGKRTFVPGKYGVKIENLEDTFLLV